MFTCQLGSGTGAGGLYAAGLGASRVVLTDGGPPALLSLCERNVRASLRRFRRRADAGLDAGLGDPDVSVEPLRWGDVASAGGLPSGEWDWVIGSDVTYDDRSASASVE